MTETQWSRFADRATQTLRDLGAENTLEITNGTASYDGIGDGDSYTYPNTPDATIDGETAHPSAVSGVDDSGTFEGIDQVAWIDADASVTIVPYGKDDPPTRVKVLENDTLFEVQEDVTTGDGYRMLTLTEL